MAKYIAEDLRKSSKIHKDDILAKYFFNAADSGLQNHRLMLQSLLFDILKQEPTFFCHFQRLYRQQRNRVSESGWQTEWLKDILGRCMRHPVRKNVYIVIDGLDESDSYDKTAEILQEFTGDGKWVMKLLVTTRPEPKFTVLQGFQTITLEEKNTPDISSYTSSFLNPDKSLKKEILEKYQNDIVKGARNIFLWVKLVRNEFRRYNEAETRRSEAAFKRFLDRIPKELEEFYQQMLERVANLETQELISNSIYMFQLVQYACRPLSLAEFNDALTILIEERVHSCKFELADNRAHNLTDLIARCSANFIETRGVKYSELLFDQYSDF